MGGEGGGKFYMSFFRGKLLAFAHITLIHFASSPPHSHTVCFFFLIKMYFLVDRTGISSLTKSLDEYDIQVYHV